LIETRKATDISPPDSAPERDAPYHQSAEVVPAHIPSRRLASAISVTGLGSVLTMAISTFASIAVARNSGPSGYAIFFAANMVVYVSAVLCSCGLPLALSKHIASEERRGHREELRRASSITLCLLLLIALVCGFAISMNLPRLEQYFGVSIGRTFAITFPLILVSAMLSDGIQGLYSGLLRTRKVVLITASGPLAMIVYIMLRIAGFPLPNWGAVATSYICSGLVACYLWWRDGLARIPSSINDLKPILKDVLPAATFTFFTIFSVWSDRWIAGTQLPVSAIGSYAAAVVVIHAILRVPTNIAYLLVPASARVALGGYEKSTRFNRAMIGSYGLFAALATVLIMLNPATIIRLLFGSEFVAAPVALLAMAPSLLTSAVTIPFISALTGSKRNRLLTYLLGLTFLPRILLLSYCTWRWSLAGTALAKVLADGLLALCCILLARKIGMGFPIKALVKPFLTALVAFAVGLGALMLNVPRLIAVILALLVFVPAILRTARSARVVTA
jgi:O-antigen/teichoic acid export membrane protein